MKITRLLALVGAVLFSFSAFSQTNLIAGWDGGNDTSSPSNFGWTSSSNATLQPRNNNGGIRMTTTYSGYNDENGNNYTYSSTSDPSSVIFWVRYNSSGESFTYTFQGLEPNHYYCFSGLVGWHNNSNAPTFTVKLNDGTNDLASMSKAVSTKTKLYSVSSNFKTPNTITNTTDIKLVFTCNQTGDCMEAISGLRLVEDNAAYEADLSKFIAYANQVNTKLSDSDLTTAISTAQGIVDDGEDNATFDDVDDLKTAISTAILAYSLDPAGDDVSSFIFRPGFEGMTAESANYGTVRGKDYSSEGWTMVETGDWGYGAIMSYGSDKTFNNASVPATDNAGNTGNTLGISVGWGWTQRYQSEVITLPAGSYRLSVKAYNANADAQQFTSKVGFVPTSGDPSLSTKTSFASNTWETDEIDFVLASATEGRFQIGGTAVSGGSGSNAKVFFDNISLTYFDPLALARIQWQEAKDAAGTAKTECPNVTGAELTALNAELAKAEPNTVDGYNQATDDIEAATATLRDAKGVYDAYYEIRAVAVALSVEPGDAPANAAAAPAATHTLNVAVYNATTAENFFDVTEIYNPSWSSMSTSSGQHWSGDGSISYADEWRGDTNPTTRNTTVTLPAGSYVLMSAGRGSDNTVTTMSANGTTVTFASNGDVGRGIDLTGAANFAETADTYNNDNNGRGWEWRFISVTLVSETDVTVTQTLTRLTASAWGSFSDFKILKVGVVATASDYTALNSAISTAEAKTLGFEDGEYAPYNNVAALTALAQAKAIDQNETNDQDIVQAVTAALSGATWTANDGDVDAIFNGTFSETGTGNNPKGWSRSNDGWGQQITGLTAGDNGVAEGTTTAWYYNNNGAWEYGKDDVYKMPLAASQTYKLSFKYRKHNSDWQTWMRASVLNEGDEGLDVVEYPGADSGTTFQSATAYFTTGAAGNYILSIEQNGNAHLTDVSLVKVASTELVLSENSGYTPELAFYETVSLTRTIAAGKWSTFVVPFDINNTTMEDQFGNDVQVSEFSAADKTGVTFTSMAEPAITANTPVLVKVSSDKTSFTFSDVTIKTGTPTVSKNGVNFVGNYGGQITIPSTLDTYYVTNNTLKKSNGNQNIKGFRAYFTVDADAPSEVKAFFENFSFDDTDAINAIEAYPSKGETIYNMAGQRVNKVQKGIYIVNGKKMLVK